jgi:hypothetical protein
MTQVVPWETRQREKQMTPLMSMPTPAALADRLGVSLRTVMIPSFIFAAAAMSVALTLAAPTQATTNGDTRFDICGALRNGTALAAIETALEARGYSASNAGALTGITIRKQCPDQAARVMAQMRRAGA